jgi:hypothetical protein
MLLSPSTKPTQAAEMRGFLFVLVYQPCLEHAQQRNRNIDMYQRGGDRVKAPSVPHLCADADAARCVLSRRNGGFPRRRK